MKKKLYSILLVALSCVSIGCAGLAVSTIQKGYAKESKSTLVFTEEDMDFETFKKMIGVNENKNNAIHVLSYDEIYSVTDLPATTYYAVLPTYAYPTPFPNGLRVAPVAAGAPVTVTGVCPSTHWLRVNINGTTAYMSDNRIIPQRQMNAENVSAMCAMSFWDAGFAKMYENAKGVYVVGVPCVDNNFYIPAITSHDISEISVQLANALRAANGIAPLKVGSLQAYTDARAVEETQAIESGKPEDHYRPDGTLTIYGENLGGSNEVFDGFLGLAYHSGHRENILNPRYSVMNASVSNSVYAQNFK